MGRLSAWPLGAAAIAVVVACGSSGDDRAPAADDAGGPPVDRAPAGDAGPVAQPDAGDAAVDAATYADTLAGNRDRLLATYLAYLKANPAPQSNGLAGPSLATTCDLWTALAPSPRAVFLTLTARLQGGALGADGSSALGHVTKLYRLVGGDGATASDPGSCGGGEANRMILSMDAALHAALVAANDHKGAAGANGSYDLSDVPTGANSFWRDSHDVGGPHAPFDLSDETDPGAPRGQVQLFRDPASAKANAPLGRTDLASLVDPYALEMDQDYDCAHNSNPSCDYTFYGPSCVPQATMAGTAIYTASYGSFDPGWQPATCAPSGG